MELGALVGVGIIARDVNGEYFLYALNPGVDKLFLDQMVQGRVVTDDMILIGVEVILAEF